LKDKLSKTSKQYDIDEEIQSKIDHILKIVAVPTVPPSPSPKDENITNYGTESTTGDENITGNEDKNDEKEYGDRGTAGTAALQTPSTVMPKEEEKERDSSLAETARLLNSFREEAAERLKANRIEEEDEE
jgi:hypothetical protein